MRGIIKILENTLEGTYHPIFYAESPLPGERTSLIRYKSKMQHTSGLASLEIAVDNINNNLLSRLEEQGYYVKKADSYEVVVWDGVEFPTDITMEYEENT
jgi:hypothetical protein